MKYRSTRLLVLLTLFLGIHLSAFAQFDATAFVEGDFDKTDYNQLIGEVNFYGFDNKDIIKRKVTCLYGDCKNGKGALVITFKGGLYYYEKETKAIYVAGDFTSGKLNGMGYIYHSLNGKAKSQLNKFLKKGKFEDAWEVKNVRPKLSGVFTDNTISEGRFVGYYDLFIPYLRESFSGSQHHYTAISNELFNGKLKLLDNIITPVFSDFNHMSFQSSALHSEEAGDYAITSETKYPSLKRLKKTNSPKNEEYLFDKHYILKGLGVTIKEIPDDKWLLEYRSGFGHENRIQIDTTISKPKGQREQYDNGLDMFSIMDSEGKANGFVSFLNKADATYTGFMLNGKYHGPGFYMSKDAAWMGHFKNGKLIEGVVVSLRSKSQAFSTRQKDSRIFANRTNSLYKAVLGKNTREITIVYATVTNGKYNGGLISRSLPYAANIPFSGEVDAFGVPNGDATVGTKEGFYKGAYYDGPTRKEQQAKTKAQAEELAYWKSQSSCGVKGKWVAINDLSSSEHKGKTVCTEKGLTSFGWIHPGVNNWEKALNSINNKPEERQRYYVSMSFPKVTAGEIYINDRNGPAIIKDNKVFIADTNPSDYYHSCGLCRGSGQLRIMSQQEKQSAVTARYTYYVITDPKGGYMVNKAIRSKREQQLDTYGRNGLSYSDTRQVPCTQCFGMGIIAK